MTNLTVEATNEGTYVITCTYLDADKVAVTPNTLKWSLTDDAGTAINARTDVAIVTPGTSNFVVLGALDLDNSAGDARVFTIEGDYDSLTYGAGLPLREQARFIIGEWVE